MDHHLMDLEDLGDHHQEDLEDPMDPEDLEDHPLEVHFP